jgi:hypothetical protein
MRLPTFAVLLILAAASMRAEVAVYPAPREEFRSPEYRVAVIQDGVRHDSFVYAHACQDEHLRDRMSDWNHWTTFSFSGRVTVEVTRLTGDVAAASIRPSARGIDAIVTGRSVSFTVEQPGQFWVKIPGAEENPLFIFADPPEENIPARNDPNVIWFEAGQVHDIGERFLIKTGQTVYIPGGAYVKGTIAAEDASRITVRGRGILSGLGYARRPNVAGIPYNTINFNGPGDEQLVEGITITNPQHFCILSRGKLTTRRVKLFGWWHQTDGWGGGEGSVVEDSFMKVNDDNVKFYAADQIARRLVIYQQVNGAVFQLGWGGAGQNATRCLAEDIDIVRVENLGRGTSREANQPVLNLRRQNEKSVIDGVTLQRVRIEDDLLFLVGMSDAAGTVDGIVLRDVAISGRIIGKNFLRATETGRIGTVLLERVHSTDGVVGPESFSLSGNVEPVASRAAPP